MAARLETERLLLEPMRLTDADRYVELIVERGPGARGHGTDVAAARLKIAQMADGAAASGIGFLALRRHGDTDMLGYCGLLVGRASLDEPELAYELLSREHGCGYATEAARAMVEAAKATGRRRLWSTVGDWNTASLRVLDKLGFHRHHTAPGPQDSDLIYLTRSL
ncbi:Protein N-acetyltransferase, RimJ/RimL family [Nakamurella panacisegetis]|uniref:Protein N-acetyltransferase, RimJ/RimL family n=2 Tax=Nakamurella panacisegetis TaxID=1090615 RepID=A0A1H0P5L6_9ACTN|nr:Protein N-acetyltransferase, RimJ/RimL family [Nakamurella panacisegetis]